MASWLEGLLRSREAFDLAVTELHCVREALYRCEIAVARQGDVALPVEIEVALADGRRLRERWQGNEDTVRLRYTLDVPVVWARVDPEGKIYLDVRPFNNSRTLRPQVGALARILRPWLLGMEQALFFLGGLW
jgi:hypothetical protein